VEIQLLLEYDLELVELEVEYRSGLGLLIVKELQLVWRERQVRAVIEQKPYLALLD